MRHPIRPFVAAGLTIGLAITMMTGCIINPEGRRQQTLLVLNGTSFDVRVPNPTEYKGNISTLDGIKDVRFVPYHDDHGVTFLVKDRQYDLVAFRADSSVLARKHVRINSVPDERHHAGYDYGAIWQIKGNSFKAALSKGNDTLWVKYVHSDDSFTIKDRRNGQTGIGHFHADGSLKPTNNQP